MRLTRHAKNRLRFIRRLVPAVTDERILAGLEAGSALGYDDRGNRKVAVEIEQARFTVIVDEASGVVITVWREE